MTPPKEPPSGLENKVNHTNRLIEGLNIRVDTLDQSFDVRLERVAETLEVLAQQIGRLTEATHETHALLRESANRRDAQIDRLLSILERLIPPAPSSN
jgi:uncharacterized protein YoxC